MTKLPGILIDANHDPVTPTIVYAPDFITFARFCKYSRVKPQSRNVQSLIHGQHIVAGDLRDCPHIAFVSFDPRTYETPADYVYSWYAIESLRVYGDITRAFYYPNPVDVEPNFEKVREWPTVV